MVRVRTRFEKHEAVALLDSIIQYQGYKCYLLSNFEGSLDTNEVIVSAVLSQDWYVNSTEGKLTFAQGANSGSDYPIRSTSYLGAQKCVYIGLDKVYASVFIS